MGDVGSPDPDADTARFAEAVTLLSRRRLKRFRLPSRNEHRTFIWWQRKHATRSPVCRSHFVFRRWQPRQATKAIMKKNISPVFRSQVSLTLCVPRTFLPVPFRYRSIVPFRGLPLLSDPGTVTGLFLGRFLAFLTFLALVIVLLVVLVVLLRVDISQLRELDLERL